MSFRTECTPADATPKAPRLTQVLFAGLHAGVSGVSGVGGVGGKDGVSGTESELTTGSFLKKTVPVAPGLPTMSMSSMSLMPQRTQSPIEPFSQPKAWTPSKQDVDDTLTVVVSKDAARQKRLEAENRMLVASSKATQEAMERAGRNAAANAVLANKLRHAVLLAKAAGTELPPGVLARQGALLGGLRRNINPSVKDNEWHYATFGESVQKTFGEILLAEVLDTAAKRVPRLPLMGSTLEPYPFFYPQMGPLYLPILECAARMTWRAVAKYEELSVHPVTGTKRVDIKIKHRLKVPSIAMQAGYVILSVRSDPQLAQKAQQHSSSVPRPTSGLAWSLSFAPGSREEKGARSALRVIEESNLVASGTTLEVSTRTLSTALNGVWDAMSFEEKKAAAAWQVSSPISVPEMYSFRVQSALRR